MSDPARAERLWLAVAVATLWLVQVGGAAEAEVAPETLPELPGPAAAGRRRRPPRRHRVFCRGLAVILAAWVQGQGPPRGRFLPEVWPDATQQDDHLTEESINQT